MYKKWGKGEKKSYEMINFPLEVKKWGFIYDTPVYCGLDKGRYQILLGNAFKMHVWLRFDGRCSFGIIN